MYKYLCQHPNVIRADMKEPTNFYRYPTSELQCRMHFPLQVTRYVRASLLRRPFITGEASAEYLSKKEVPLHVQRLLPEVKLIILLRNPVTRAYSDYQMLRRFETESFEDVVTRALRWLENDDLALLREAVCRLEHQPLRYVERGLYLDHIEEWVKCFGPKQMMFIKSEELFAEPQRIYDEVCQFLGLKQHVLPEFPIAKRGSYAEKIPAEVTARLKAFYRPHNQRLYEFLGRDLRWEEEV